MHFIDSFADMQTPPLYKRVQRRGLSSYRYIGVFSVISFFLYTIYTPFWRGDAWNYMKIYFCRNPESPYAIRVYRDFMDL